MWSIPQITPNICASIGSNNKIFMHINGEKNLKAIKYPTAEPQNVPQNPRRNIIRN